MDHSSHSDHIKDLETQIKHLKKLGNSLYNGGRVARYAWEQRRDVTFVYGRASDDTSKLTGNMARLMTSEEVSSKALKLLKEVTCLKN